MEKITVLGAGFAGCEAAWHLAQSGYKVELVEMKPVKFTPAHKSENFCELVCSNSFKAKRIESAAGLLKAEMSLMGSLCVECAYECSVEAGGALAVDREKFSALVTERIRKNENITVVNRVVEDIPKGKVIVATGPLTDGALAQRISELCGESLSFYDAAAPIVTGESIDMNSAFFASRYGKGGDDYINCPMNKEEYEKFHYELVNAESAKTHDFDVYEGCMPIEVLAKRGEDSIRFGPMKPVGLTDPRTGHRPWAVLQLRRENSAGSMYNLVGFQTNLKFSEQKRVFSMIPALKNAQFTRYGVMHRNSFLDSPRVLDRSMRLKDSEDIYFAGQITGVEGYMESACSGIIAAMNLVRQLRGEPKISLPEQTMSGSLISYITDESVKDFQPMGANFGVVPPLETRIRDKEERYGALAQRALDCLKNYLKKIDFWM